MREPPKKRDLESVYLASAFDRCFYRDLLGKACRKAILVDRRQGSILDHDLDCRHAPLVPLQSFL